MLYLFDRLYCQQKDYFNMLKVTLISARKNTSLRLICLYDGKIGDPVYNLLKRF